MAVASLFDGGKLAESSSYIGSCRFPYVSGLFYLREGPFAVEAVRGLRARPHLLCFDAHGAAHPRLAGMATICGTILGIPSVGLAKSPLVGTVTPDKAGLERIVLGGRTVGFSTFVNRKPRYWSMGYSISLRQLELLMRKYASVCVQAMAESDRSAAEQARATASVQP